MVEAGERRRQSEWQSLGQAARTLDEAGIDHSQSFAAALMNVRSWTQAADHPAVDRGSSCVLLFTSDRIVDAASFAKSGAASRRPCSRHAGVPADREATHRGSVEDLSDSECPLSSKAMRILPAHPPFHLA